VNDVQENVRRFNQEEALWQRYEQKRKERRRLGRCFPKAEELLDQLDRLAAERETRPSDCVGKPLS